MAFTIANWACISTALNQGQETVTPFLGSATVLNAPNVFIYGSPNDTAAQIAAANYFLPQYASLCVGDWIMGNGTDVSFSLLVTAVSATAVTTQASVLTSNNAKYLAVPMTLSQFLGMYAAPFQLLPAPGAGLMNIIDSVNINLVFGSAALAGGGAVGLQYGNTVHGGGPAASATEAATDYTAAAANTMFRIGGGLGTGVATSAAINTAIYISNATAAFTGGTGDTFIVNVYYKTVAAT